jgi:ComEC/Rec2-related protein
LVCFLLNGFDLSIVARLFSGLSARLLGRRRAMPVAVAGIILYTILVGASAAVVRAAIMGSLYVIAIHYGRQSDALNSLMAAAILMTALNPFTLWDLGFQLSFAATLGLVLYTPVVQGWFEGGLRRLLSEEATQKAIGLLNEALVVTLAVQSAMAANSIWGLLRSLDKSKDWGYNKLGKVVIEQPKRQNTTRFLSSCRRLPCVGKDSIFGCCFFLPNQEITCEAPF